MTRKLPAFKIMASNSLGDLPEEAAQELECHRRLDVQPIPALPLETGTQVS